MLHELHSLMQEAKIATICSCNQEGFFLFPIFPLMLKNSHPFIYQDRQSHTPHAYYDLFIAALSSCSVVSCVISPHFVSTAEEILKVRLLSCQSVVCRPNILFQNAHKSDIFPHYFQRIKNK